MSTFWCGWCGAALTRETEDAHRCESTTERLRREHDALAAKVADAWNEGKNAGAADSAQIIGWAVSGANPDNEPELSSNPYRADLAETEKP